MYNTFKNIFLEAFNVKIHIISILIKAKQTL